MRSEPIAVIGAGIGGLGLALSLAARGLQVAVYEQAAALGEIGAGLHLSPNGMKVARALGLGPALDAVAARPRAITTRHYASGAENFSGPLDADFEARFGAPFYSFHRADLHRVLTTAATASPRITIRTAHRLEKLSLAADQVTLTFDNGAEISSPVVVGADGVHSRVRAATLGELGARFTGHVAYRGMAATEDLPPGLVPEMLNIWVGPGKHVVAYPVRRGELINYVALVEEDDWQNESWTTRASKAGLAEGFAAWHPTVRTLIDHTLSGECYKWALLVRDPLQQWSTARTTLLGDAAHPMVPYLAQGAVMALEDAWVLAACLADEPNPGAALGRYQGARQQRTADIQAAAWEQGQMNHAVGRGEDGDRFRGGRFSDPAWIYGHDVVADYPL